MSFPYQIHTEQEYTEQYQKSIQSPEKFWDEIAQNFVWRKKWKKVVEYDFTTANTQWFIDGKLNITENCLDRHLASNSDSIALIWESNFIEEEPIKLTYSELHIKVLRFAQVLKNNGIHKGDRVCINMGMIPELCIALLACARIGAIHSVIFGGFSASSISDRVKDAGAKFLICSDGAFRGDKVIPIKSIVDDALKDNFSIEKVIVFRRTNIEINMTTNRDVWWNEEDDKLNIIEDHIEIMDSEDPLFILYTSGSTGKPKGVIHSIGGYMVYTAYSFVNVFQYQKNQIHFCTADVGWITGHSYIVYGPLLSGATSLLFEGVPNYPDAGRFWDIIDKFKVNIFYTAPTAIRSLMIYGTEIFDSKSLSSLTVIGSVGEPINEEAYNWFDKNVGKNKCAIVDTWWQTETGGILISNLAGVTKSSATFAGQPLPGIQLLLLSESGQEIVKHNEQGNLCIQFPWPSIIRSTYGDHERCRLNYFSIYPKMYFTGDGAFRDENGLYRIIGRVDDVLNVSGHRIGTAELENAINSHPLVIESAVVGFQHEIKGEGIYAYVILKNSNPSTEHLKLEIIEIVKKEIGSFAKPDEIQIVSGLPKTRSGKIMRRILRKIAENKLDQLGDLSSLLDASVIEKITKEKS
ncbi:MAG: acetate--CoA ligase [Saprospiraceae bacterium]